MTLDQRADLISSLSAGVPWAMTEEAMRSLLEVARAQLRGELRIDAAVGPEQISIGPEVRRANTVTIIPIRGVIRQHPAGGLMGYLFGGGANTDTLTAQIRAAVEDPAVKSIILDVDSPGGSTFGLTELHAEIIKARAQKPILAVANSTMASAAYWIASAASEIIAAPGAIVGSIGVISVHEDVSQMAENEGVKVTFLTAGRFKAGGNRFEPLDAEYAQRWQSRIDEVYGMFVRDVAKGRGVSEAVVRKDFGEGDIMLAKPAKAAGMLDGIMSFDRAIVRAGVARPLPPTPDAGDEDDLDLPAHPQPAPLQFDEQGEALLTEASSYLRRSRLLMDRRERDGRTVSEDRREQISAVIDRVEEAIGMVREALPLPEAQESDEDKRARAERWAVLQSEARELAASVEA